MARKKKKIANAVRAPRATKPWEKMLTGLSQVVSGVEGAELDDIAKVFERWEDWEGDVLEYEDNDKNPVTVFKRHLVNKLNEFFRDAYVQLAVTDTTRKDFDRCPWCTDSSLEITSDGVVNRESDDGSSQLVCARVIVHCTTCDVERIFKDTTFKEAAELWNKRPAIIKPEQSEAVA